MQQIAMTWLVYKLTKSEWLLGLVAFSGQIPTAFISPFAGVLTDRWNRHKTLLITQSLAMTQAFLLAFLTYMNILSVSHIIILAILLGVINAVDMPLRQTFLSDIVIRAEDLPNALAVNSSMVNTTRLLGPILTSLVIHFKGEAFCFFLNGLSYLAVLAALLKMHVTHHKRKSDEEIFSSLKEGIQYCASTPSIRIVLLTLSFTSMTTVSLTTLLPFFSDKFFTAGANGLGILSAILGAGALTGAIGLAFRTSHEGLSNIITYATISLGISMMAFAYSPYAVLSYICLFFSGAANIAQMVASNSLLQITSNEDKRGRVLSLYIVSLLGFAPFGNLLAGYLGSHIGAASAVGISGLATLLSGFFFHNSLMKQGLTSKAQL